MQIHKKGFFFKVLQKGCKQAKQKQSKAKDMVSKRGFIAMIGPTHYMLKSEVVAT
jgi:hypothetical protein